jgi:hypothetical protein
MRISLPHLPINIIKRSLIAATLLTLSIAVPAKATYENLLEEFPPEQRESIHTQLHALEAVIEANEVAKIAEQISKESDLTIDQDKIRQAVIDRKLTEFKAEVAASKAKAPELEVEAAEQAPKAKASKSREEQDAQDAYDGMVVKITLLGIFLVFVMMFGTVILSFANSTAKTRTSQPESELPEACQVPEFPELTEINWILQSVNTVATRVGSSCDVEVTGKRMNGFALLDALRQAKNNSDILAVLSSLA